MVGLPGSKAKLLLHHFSVTLSDMLKSCIFSHKLPALDTSVLLCGHHYGSDAVISGFGLQYTLTCYQETRCLTLAKNKLKKSFFVAAILNYLISNFKLH